MTTIDEAEDRSRLEHILKEYVGVPDTGWDTHPVTLALKRDGVERFEREFVSMTPQDLLELQYVDAGDNNTLKGLPRVTTRKLIAVLAFYHDGSRSRGKSINPKKIPQDIFDEWRISYYDHNEKIRPWQVTVPKPKTPEEEALITWKKTIKVSPSDYKPFKDDALWDKHKKGFTDTLDSHNLSHLVDPDCVPPVPELDVIQCKWLFKVMKDTFLTPMSKTIVLRHNDTKDVRAIWKEVVEHYDKSMTGEISAQTISTYVMSTRLENIDWRGTQTQYILHFAEQLRLYNELCPDEPYSEKMKVQFLKNSVMGVANLATVYENFRASCKATRRENPRYYDVSRRR